MIAFEYKCRRCGEVEKGLKCDSYIMGILHLQETINNSEYKSSAIELNMYRIHNCKDGGAGVMDLIGYGVVGKEDQKKESPTPLSDNIFIIEERKLLKKELSKVINSHEDHIAQLFSLVCEMFCGKVHYDKWKEFTRKWCDVINDQ